MTALPEVPTPLAMPTHPLTVAEYAALGETEPGYTELQEGRLLMSPSPAMRHNLAVFALASQLTLQSPRRLRVVPDIDVDLQLAAADQPGWSRRPDLIVVDQSTVDRVNAESGLARADEIVLAVEIVSPGSRRTDNVIKRGEYADAGIGHYWIVDLDPPVSLLACHLAGDFGYADDGAHCGRYTAADPFPVTIDLDQLG